MNYKEGTIICKVIDNNRIRIENDSTSHSENSKIDYSSDSSYIGGS